MDIILDIEVCPPVANLRGALQSLDGQHGESEVIVDGDLLLVLLNEGSIRGGWDIIERSVRNGDSGSTLGRDAARCEGNFFGLRVAEDRESNSPEIVGDLSAARQVWDGSATCLSFVLWTWVLYGLRTNKSVSYLRVWRPSWVASGGKGCAACV